MKLFRVYEVELELVSKKTGDSEITQSLFLDHGIKDALLQAERKNNEFMKFADFLTVSILSIKDTGQVVRVPSEDK
jgi:hypothetical protein